MDFAFHLSQGLFSSADVDVGTRLLLRELSGMIDLDAGAGRPPPGRVLDAGCGVGVIGICAAATLPGSPLVRCQDRDELARLFTLRNAAGNGVSLDARTEPLLAGDVPWDLILSNVPAKAGTPVLEDFVSRSLGLLNPGGRVAVVVVQPLADFFRGRIALAGAEILSERSGSGHVVFAYAPGEGQGASTALESGPGFLSRYPFYVRASVRREIQAVPVKIDAVHGASGFDEAGGAVAVAARLVARLGPEVCGSPLLVHEPGQGFFPCWLLAACGDSPVVVLSGRNVLALEAARHNVSRLAAVVPAADLRLGGRALLEAVDGGKYACLAAFPELLPQSSLPKGTDQLASLWGAVPPLLAVGGLLLVTLASSDAERFDRRKPAGFTRLGGIRRDGFRALAYRLGERGLET